MKVQINLASDPFRRDRPMIFASTVVAVLLTGVLAMLIYLAAGERDRSAESREMISKLQGQLLAISNEQAKLEGVLRQPANAEVLDLSVFLNELLARKGVSWTKIFSDLESVTPHNVRLVQVRPQITAKNELMLDMVVAAQSVEPILAFIMKLEESSVFGATTPHNSLPPSQTDPLYRYRLSVTYAQKL
jgi:type IV pilus assembly protein PilN